MRSIAERVNTGLTPIIDALQAYSRTERARWHTPGHKGRVPFPYLVPQWDVTEIRELTPQSDGDDVLHHSERLMAETFGALRTWYSVQGATLPVMAAILAACPSGARVVVDRIAHRSVHSALALANLDPIWAYSSVGPGGYPLPVCDTDRVGLIEEHSPVAVIVTNPTYEGLSASLDKTRTLCREKGIILIVDEAHGTHFWGHRGFPASALAVGADLVCHGVHKTDVSLTQTGLLHMTTHQIPPSRVQEAWDLLATSSPSYLLLASLDYLQSLRHQVPYHRHWESFAQDMRESWEIWRNQGLFLLQEWWERQGGQADPAKLTLIGDGMRFLRTLEAFGVEEKSDPSGLTLIVTPQDDRRLLHQALECCASGSALVPGESKIDAWPRTRQILSLHHALSAEREWVPWREAVHRIAARPIIPYPPGIPLVVPGEEINRDVVSWLEGYRQWSLQGSGNLQGIQREPGLSNAEGDDNGLWVIKGEVP